MEIRRFGVGHRRPDGPARTTGVTGQVIHADARGTIVELAFARGARMEPHTCSNSAWFVVIEGGGWVQVGDETARVAAGEAVRWPAGLDHAARSGLSEMRAIVVELAGPDDTAAAVLADGSGEGVDGRIDRGGGPHRGERAGAGAADRTALETPVAHASPAASPRARATLSPPDGDAGPARTEGEPL